MKTSVLKRAKLGPVTLALAAVGMGGCFDTGDGESNVTSRRSALSATTGDLSTTLFWNGSAVESRDRDLFSVDLTGPSGRVSADPQPGLASYLAADLLPGDYIVAIDPFRCTTGPRFTTSAFITANETTVLGGPLTDLSNIAGRITGQVQLDGDFLPPSTPARLNRRCLFDQCPVGGTTCEFYQSYDTTVGDLMGQLLPASLLDVAFFDGEGGAISFLLNVPAGQTTDLGVIAPGYGFLDGRVLWNGAPVLDQAARALTVAGHLDSGGGAFPLPHLPGWSTHPEGTGTYRSPRVPLGQYVVTLESVTCAPAEGQDPINLAPLGFVRFSTTGDTGEPVHRDIDTTNGAGRVTGDFTLFNMPAHVRLALGRDGGECDSIESNVDGHLEALLPPGHYSARISSIQTGQTIGTTTLSVTAGQTTSLGDVNLAPTPSNVDGTVYYDGQPVSGPAGAGLHLGGVLGSGPLAGDGTFTVPAVPPGTHVGRVLICDQVLAENTFEIVSGPITTVDFDLTPNTGRVVGTITVNGAPVAGAYIWAFGALCPLRTDAQGRFDQLLPARTEFNSIVSDAGGSALSLTDHHLGPLTFFIDEGQTTDVGSVNFPPSQAGALTPLGAPCTSGPQCVSGFCADGVCCNDACGNNELSDCRACSIAAGGSADGMCNPLPQCSGAPVPTCSSGGCPEITVPGANGAIDHVTITFPSPIAAGEVSARPCSAVAEVSNGYKILTNMLAGGNELACLDLEVSSSVAYRPPVEVCVYYSDELLQDGVGGTRDVNTFELWHDEGSGFQPITTFRVDATLDHGPGICGNVDTFSPFAVVTRVDTTPPVFGNLPPNPLVAYATSTAGTTVNFAPTAVDAVDGPVPVSCTRASGAFPVGKTPVTCTATDSSQNTATLSFQVWVQYQAPADGTFFLKPIRPDGSSVFRIGRAVPVKLQLQGASAGIKNLVARLEVTKVSGNVAGNTDCDSDEDGEDADMLFKYRKASGIYGYRWKTRGEAKGTYRLRADLGDGVAHEITISLKGK